MPQYNGVWTIEAAAQAQSNQQWVTDPNFKNTTLLLQADNAANTLQNNTFIDSSTNGLTITRGANATQGSYTQFSQQPGYWSNFFDGSGDSFSVSTSTVLDLNGAIDFTIEAWVFLTGYGSSSDMSLNIANKFTGAGGLGYSYGIFGGGANQGKIQFYGAAGSVSILSTNVIPLNSWNHVAIVKNGTTYTHYLNGVANGSQTTATTLSASTNALVIGDYGYSDDFLGYMSNLRITKSGALYTGTFTPSTSPLTTTVSAGTVSLLTFQSNRFVDNSSNGFTLTPSGTPSVQAFSPFAPQFQWTPSFIGGSAYFDGSSYVTVPNATSTLLGSSDFTFEFWANRSATSALEDVVLHWNSVAGGTGYGAIRLTIFASSTSLYLSTNGTTWAVISTVSVAVPNNGWFYCALVRSGGNISLFINGTRVTTTTTITSGTALYAGTVNRVGYMNLTADVRSWTGYVSNFRFTKSAVYDPTLTTMTVPTALTVPIANTQTQLNFTNAGIYDAAMDNVLQTVGSAQVSTSVVKYGSGSMAFDGTGDYLQMPYSPNLDLSAGDFTIEGWLYLNSVSPTTQGVMTLFNGNALSGSNIQYLVRVNTSNLVIEAYISTTTYTITFSGITAGAWNHFAFVRSGNILSGYLNGVKNSTTQTLTGSLNTNTAWLYYIGRYTSGGTNYDLNGYLDDVRITKGIARYYQNFIPPLVALPRQ